MKTKIILVLFGMSLLMSSACILRRSQQVKMGGLSSEVTKLSKAVETSVRYSDVSTINDSELLAKSTEHNPELLKIFSGYFIRIARNDKDVIILICTKDQKRALFEDAGCTPELDKEFLKENLKCDFTSKVEIACPVK
jgi:hypothetical protein